MAEIVKTLEGLKVGMSCLTAENLNDATKASWKNRDSGEYDSRAEWHHVMSWGNLTKFAQTLKKGEHVYVSGELRYREYQKAVGEGKNIVTMPVAEIHAAEIRRLAPRTSEDGTA